MTIIATMPTEKSDSESRAELDRLLTRVTDHNTAIELRERVAEMQAEIERLRAELGQFVRCGECCWYRTWHGVLVGRCEYWESDVESPGGCTWGVRL